MDVACDYRGGLKLDPFPRHDGTAHLSCHHGLLRVQIAFDDRTGRHQHLGSDPDGASDAALDPNHSLCLEVADHRHVARDNGERNLVGPPTTQLVPLLVLRLVIEDAHQLPSLTMVRGSSETPFWRISKCSW